VMSTFHSWWPFSAFGVVQKVCFTIAGGGVRRPVQNPLNDAAGGRRQFQVLWSTARELN